MEQIIKVKCPHCGWVRKIELDVEIGRAEVARGESASAAAFFSQLSQTWKEKIQALLKDSEPDPENDWLPLPPCPSCGKAYEYNVKTGKCR
jgi:hypothetical protein